MRKVAAALGAVALLTLGPIAEGQSPEPKQDPSAFTRTVNLTAEQRHVIKEIVKELHLASAPANAPTNMGETVPQTVRLEPIPAELAQKVPQVKSHLFYVKEQRIVLVDPKDNTVADVIE